MCKFPTSALLFLTSFVALKCELVFVSYPKLSPESSRSSISSGPTSSTPPVCLWVTLQHPMMDEESVPLSLVSASSPHTEHHLPRQSSPLCVCVCHTKTKEITLAGWVQKRILCAGEGEGEGEEGKGGAAKL